MEASPEIEGNRLLVRRLQVARDPIPVREVERRLEKS
jgi:hypothetical protein